MSLLIIDLHFIKLLSNIKVLLDSKFVICSFEKKYYSKATLQHYP